MHTTEVSIQFQPNTYSFMGGSGAQTLTVSIFNLPGNLQCDVEVTVSLVNGPKASKCFLNIFIHIKLQN